MIRRSVIVTSLVALISARSTDAFANETSEAGTEKREQLVPVIRHKHFIDEAKKGERAGLSFPERQIAGDIYVFYAFDMPDTVRYADAGRIKALGLNAPELDRVAVTNLERIMSAPLIDTHPDMTVLSSTDSYLTSTLLIDQFWTKDKFKFRGDLVVFVIARDLMVVTGSEEPEGLKKARKMGQEVIGALPYAISLDPIVRRDGKWQSFVQ